MVRYDTPIALASPDTHGHFRTADYFPDLLTGLVMLVHQFQQPASACVHLYVCKLKRPRIISWGVSVCKCFSVVFIDAMHAFWYAPDDVLSLYFVRRERSPQDVKKRRADGARSTAHVTD
jgi:hypothetical protein